MDEAATSTFWVTHALLPALLCAGLAAAISIGGWDWAVADAFYDPAARGWLLDPALGRALHGGERGLIFAVALGLLAALTQRAWRRPASYLLLCLALTASLVSLGKHVTGVDCPRDLARYGASPRARAGECFPAGHSSSAFALVALYFLPAARRPRWRRAGLAAGLGLGLAFAATQWGRGMHVPSHDLVSAALAWAVALAAYTAVYRRRLWNPPHAPAAD